jgi:protein phosphatase
MGLWIGWNDNQATQSAQSGIVRIPDPSLVVLIGVAGSGKSTFAMRHFRATEVVSSDACRAMVSDDPANQAATRAAFEVLHLIVAKRLEFLKLAVIDATNVQPRARERLIRLAAEHDLPAIAIVLDLPARLCEERDRARPDRQVGPDVIRYQYETLHRSLPSLASEGFRAVYHLTTPEAIEGTRVERVPLPPDRRTDHGPFDIIGDVHGCFDELCELLGELGYAISERACEDSSLWYHVRPPAGRRALFLGDLVDRGPNNPAVLRLVMGMVEAGTALCVPGNHDDKLMRYLNGRKVKIAHGLATTLEQLERESPEFRERVRAFIAGLTHHYVLDGGRLVVAHAGMKEQLQGRDSKRVRDYALYGETTGELDEYGLPIRIDWAAHYQGRAIVVYGHTPVHEPTWVNRTINIDTGCVFGGRLTALRYPELVLTSVLARQTYAVRGRPFLRPVEAGLPPAPGFAVERVLGTENSVQHSRVNE